MIITGTHLPRRTFLRGLGAAVALPMLDAMTPALARAVPTGAAPKRLVFTYVPNGVSMTGWTPQGTGSAFELSTVLKPLAAYKDDMLVLSGLAQRNGMALGDGPGDHARAAASYLTGVHPKKTAGADIQNGISADQIVAQHIGKATRFGSIELGCDDSRTVGNCDSGYSCAYSNSLSWRSETSPMPPETNPRLVFERLFGADAHLDPAARQRRLLARRSILDVVGERTKQLSSTLGASDRRKVDEYLHAVREIERQIEVAESDMRDLRPGIDKPTGIPVAFADYVKLMYDLQVVAFQTDLTRVVTMMVGREGSMRTYPEIGVPDPHHPLTHHRNNKDWMARVEQINVFHAELFAYFVGKMKATPEGDSNLLERSLIVYGSGLSDGNRHTHEDLPVMIVGQGGGLLRTGRHVVYDSQTPMNNLYLTLMDGMGVPAESLGDSTGKLEHLTGVS
ncbi:DUF1552 domain-containing protein [Luteitalea sp.]|uniref:DUF1552 domain-containing protein n=1 Tax=Luteitalea sp. TaxID=2004800 RepID=UPI000B32E573|nr:DUF1552 domain-containing protein [Luteitalea sp.]